MAVGLGQVRIGVSAGEGAVGRARVMSEMSEHMLVALHAPRRNSEQYTWGMRVACQTECESENLLCEIAIDFHFDP